MITELPVESCFFTAGIISATGSSGWEKGRGDMNYKNTQPPLADEIGSGKEQKNPHKSDFVGIDVVMGN